MACIRLEDTLLDLWHSHAWCVTHHLSVVYHGSPDVSLIVRLVLSSRINPHLKMLAHLEIVSHWDLLRVATMCLEGLVLLAKACLIQRREQSRSCRTLRWLGTQSAMNWHGSLSSRG